MSLKSIKVLALACLFATVASVSAEDGEKPVARTYVKAPDAPAMQTWAEADAKSKGCVSCHTDGKQAGESNADQKSFLAHDQQTMHASKSVVLGCVDCHGGDASVQSTGKMYAAGDHAADHAGQQVAGKHDENTHGEGKHEGHHGKSYDPNYQAAMDKAHVLPRYPETWGHEGSANPVRGYTLLNREAPEFTRFVNPSDLRIVEESCGACHQQVITAAKTSIMATGAMLWGGASYNNGILPYKRYIMGESYTREGKAASIKAPVPVTEAMKKRGILEVLHPLPAWEVIPPADIFRVFERGGRNINSTFPETGLPNSLGQIQRLEEPGRPDIKQSNRGPGTGARIAVPVINIHKTRLNDPNMWFMGTNDQPGDYRQSGCAACHVVYANDRDPRHSGPYAGFGHTGLSQTKDPTIPKDQSGHPLKHAFTRAIPTSNCMVCHMHQPNMFMNTFLGYTMWDYESDAPAMWPKKQHYPSDEELRKTLERNPEEAAIRGLWRDVEFLKQVSEMNPKLNDTQFADYHGHGWNFRAVFKRDREGTLLDANGGAIDDKDPKKFEKAVHMSSIHVDKGMHCVDCHFSQDMHGTGHIVGEVAAPIEISCKDCHGTPDALPSLVTSNVAASEQGRNLANLRNPDGKKRFEWIDGKLIQRSLLTPGLEWEMSLLKENSNPTSTQYNLKADRAHTMSKNTSTQAFGQDVARADYAHGEDKMQCYTCHLSWTTTCGGCHLPIQANAKTERHHFEGGSTRNYATYNPQVARDDAFQLGVHGEAKGAVITPLRSTSALILSSTNSSRERIYIQQPPIASSGYSSQAFGVHYPHTERKTETKTCSDCHLSADNDNNAIMTQLLSHGTKFFDFFGFNAWVGGDGEITAVRVTEWEEPQAVVGSYLHEYAYPDFFQKHQSQNKVLQEGYRHSSGEVNCLQLRGEFVYAAEGNKGMRVYDAANIANKGYSQRFQTALFSPLGDKSYVPSKNATCVSLLTTQPIRPAQNQGDLMRKENLEQPFSPIYGYAYITDAEEGLIVTDIDTFMDGEPRNNFLTRALTWNQDGVLNGARHLTNAGYYFYISTPKGVVVLDMRNPMTPKYLGTIEIPDARAAQVQFRYLFVTSGKGLQVVDITDFEQPRLTDALIPLQDAHKLHVARTYAYVAAGAQGLAIINVTNPEQPKMYQLFNAGGALSDARDVTVATTNASLFAYVADGKNGLKVLQLTSPRSQPKFYGFSPQPKPELIASYGTKKPALALSRALERDRAVDETGGQIAVLGRLGSKPFSLEQMRKMFMNPDGSLWRVRDRMDSTAPAAASASAKASNGAQQP
jgi:LVIVD repeat